jgi:hypothetical protein
MSLMTATAPRFSGELLRRRRLELNIRPEVVAAGSGRSLWGYLSYEKGLNDPPTNVTAKIARILSCDINDLMETPK